MSILSLFSKNNWRVQFSVDVDVDADCCLAWLSQFLSSLCFFTVRFMFNDSKTLLINSKSK